MVADSFIKSQMHRMPTYDEIIYDTVINPTYRISLPDRMATQLRTTHQLTRFDEVDETPDLAAEQEKITKERLKELALQSMGGVGKDETVSLKRAAAPRPDYEKMAQQCGGEAPPPPPPAAADKRGWFERVNARWQRAIHPPDRDLWGWRASVIDTINKRWDDEQYLRNEIQ